MYTCFWWASDLFKNQNKSISNIINFLKTQAKQKNPVISLVYMQDFHHVRGNVINRYVKHKMSGLQRRGSTDSRQMRQQAATRLAVTSHAQCRRFHPCHHQHYCQHLFFLVTVPLAHHIELGIWATTNGKGGGNTNKQQEKKAKTQKDNFAVLGPITN